MATLLICDLVNNDTPSVNSVIKDDTDKHMLTCSKHDLLDWCNCRARMLTTNADAAQIAAMDENNVTVPVVPTKGYNANVLVVPLHRENMHSFMFVPKGFNEDGIHIGVTTRYDGRLAMRLMLWDWLIFAYNDSNYLCEQPIHQGGPALKGPWGSPQERVLNVFSLLTTGACTVCAPYLDASSDVPVDPSGA